MATIEGAITRMSLALETAKKIEPNNPALQRRHWLLKRALNRIEFEMLIALGGIDEDLELLDAEIRSESAQLAKVIQFKANAAFPPAAKKQIGNMKKENVLEQ
ncbi:hypothetical protein [Oligoflexus tunisiensis]|uniref:hypothetical protein n=1 Tax=Oligoflexus tunisiensis TaxID=708132 RepID=UPI001C4082B4|nr:hypothetical protein [Oligoflexus tunisiensis]